MSNNLVFNPVASQLLTQIYGADGTNIRPIAVDSTGKLNVVGAITATISGVVTATISGVVTATISGTVTANVSPSFTESNSTVVFSTAGTLTVITEDVSQQKQISFVVYNNLTTPVTALLQVAPTDTDSYYVNDGTAVVIGTPTSLSSILVPVKFLKFTRILLNGGATASAIVYYNAQSL